MARITLKDLTGQLDINRLVEQAEERFYSQQSKRQRFSQRIAALIPLGTILAWAVAYALSAPHTAALFIRITPPVMDALNLAVFAPIVIEGFIAILSALRAYGVRGYGVMVWALMGLSMAVNVIGGLVHFSTLNSANPIEQLWAIASIPAGIIVSFLSMVTGAIVVQFARGEISLELARDSFAGTQRYNAIYAVIYDAVIKLGGSPSQAENIATNNARRLSQDAPQIAPPEPVQAVGLPHVAPVATVAPVASLSQQDFGFAGIAQKQAQNPAIQQNDRRDTLQGVADATQFVAYADLPDKAGFIREALHAQPHLLRMKSGRVAMHLFGQDTPTIRRTIQRVIKDMQP